MSISLVKYQNSFYEIRNQFICIKIKAFNRFKENSWTFWKHFWNICNFILLLTEDDSSRTKKIAPWKIAPRKLPPFLTVTLTPTQEGIFWRQFPWGKFSCHRLSPMNAVNILMWIYSFTVWFQFNLLFVFRLFVFKKITICLIIKVLFLRRISLLNNVNKKKIICENLTSEVMWHKYCWR